MKNFTSVKDVDNVLSLVREGLEIKKHPFANGDLGKQKTLGLIFMNPSLRTRMSTQKAAKNLGMDVMVMNMGTDGWGLETRDGIIMNEGPAEHIREAAAVIGQYCDIVGLRSFPKFESQEADYADTMLNMFKQYSGVPVVSLESTILHPLQSLADMITIEELKTKDRPKVVLTWAPHIKVLPQAVANSFAEWVTKMDAEVVIAHPEGYELNDAYTVGASITNNQKDAFEGADFIYAKNWSSYTHYGKNDLPDKEWMVDMKLMGFTNNAKFMHCLPVRRNLVVSDAVLDSAHSVVVQQAGNRLFAAQAVLKQILESDMK